MVAFVLVANLEALGDNAEVTVKAGGNVAGKLIICPTPLGNLGDMTPRAIQALQEAQVVCAEDTRVTGKLLAAFHLEKRIERLDEELMGSKGDTIIGRVLSGEVIAYCSDAGMPGVSDPGLRLVSTAREKGAVVEVLPGPTAAATAYVASGTINPRFYFGGFFPRKDSERKSVLDQVKQLDAALVFYESPHRVTAALEVIAQVFPTRKVALCRELTKLHEEVLWQNAQELLCTCKEREEQGGFKGEIVLVIDGSNAEEAQADSENAQQKAQERGLQLKQEGLRNKDIARRLSEEFGLPRNTAYDIALQL